MAAEPLHNRPRIETRVFAGGTDERRRRLASKQPALTEDKTTFSDARGLDGSFKLPDVSSLKFVKGAAPDASAPGGDRNVAAPSRCVRGRDATQTSRRLTSCTARRAVRARFGVQVAAEPLSELSALPPAADGSCGRSAGRLSPNSPRCPPRRRRDDAAATPPRHPPPRSKPVAVLFWGKYAKGDYRTMVHFSYLMRALPELQVLGVSCDAAVEDCEAMLKKNGTAMPTQSIDELIFDMSLAARERNFSVQRTWAWSCGAAAAATRTFRGDESRRGRGRDADTPRRRVAAPPRLRHSVETSLSRRP